MISFRWKTKSGHHLPVWSRLPAKSNGRMLGLKAERRRPVSPPRLQPAAGANELRVARTETGTLTLTTPAPSMLLWVLASSGSGGGMDDVTINYDDGSSDFMPDGYDAGDWCDNAFRGAIQNLGRARFFEDR